MKSKQVLRFSGGIFDYDNAKALAESNGVRFEYAFESGDVLKTMYIVSSIILILLACVKY